MSETIELVEQARADGKTVKEACKTAGISMPTYYAQRRKLNGSRKLHDGPKWAKLHETTKEAADSRYLAILDALHWLHKGDVAGAKDVLVGALKD